MRTGGTKGDIRAVALLLAVSVVGGACTAAGSEAGSGSSATDQSRAETSRGDRQGSRGTKPSVRTSDAKDDSDEHNAKGEGTSVADTAEPGEEASSGFSFFEEAEPDREGDADAPAYAELTAASIESSGKDAVFELHFGADLPPRVAKGQNLIAGMGLLPDDSHPQFAVVLQGTHEGWTAALQTNEGMSPISDAPVVEGRTATMSLPWKEVMGFREFRWGASLRWYDMTSTPQRGVADKLPNDGPARFPSDEP